MARLPMTTLLRQWNEIGPEVATSIEVERSPEDMLAGHPSLMRKHLDLCSIYAEAYPLREYPRMRAVPAGARFKPSRLVPPATRRPKAGGMSRANRSTYTMCGAAIVAPSHISA